MVNKSSITISLPEDLYHRIGYISLNWNLSEEETVIRLLKRATLAVEDKQYRDAIDKYLDATLQRG